VTNLSRPILEKVRLTQCKPKINSVKPEASQQFHKHLSSSHESDRSKMTTPPQIFPPRRLRIDRIGPVFGLPDSVMDPVALLKRGHGYLVNRDRHEFNKTGVDCESWEASTGMRGVAVTREE
jgi:hypothetical protein